VSGEITVSMAFDEDTYQLLGTCEYFVHREWSGPLAYMDESIRGMTDRHQHSRKKAAAAWLRLEQHPEVVAYFQGLRDRRGHPRTAIEILNENVQYVRFYEALDEYRSEVQKWFEHHVRTVDHPEPLTATAATILRFECEKRAHASANRKLEWRDELRGYCDWYGGRSFRLT